jgi:hypothetical protein
LNIVVIGIGVQVDSNSGVVKECILVYYIVLTIVQIEPIVVASDVILGYSCVIHVVKIKSIGTTVIYFISR